MSTRTTLRPYSLPTINMASTTASSATIMQSLSMLSYAISWTGTTPVGTLALQFSDDYSVSPNGETVIKAGTWNTAPMDIAGAFVTSASVSGNTGNGIIDVTTTGHYAVRLLYTAGSGTGTLSIIVSGKVA